MKTKIVILIRTFFGEDAKQIHLPSAFVMEDFNKACSMNVWLFDSSSVENIPQTDRLREFIESARSALHPTEVSKVSSLHTIIQLIQILRCLPNSTIAADRLADAANLSPPSLDPAFIHRQSGSWKESLTGVFITCGTHNCMSIVLDRLEAMTSFVERNLDDTSKLSQDVVLVEEMLYKKLWITLAHFKLPTEESFQRMVRCCKTARQKHQFICLTALSNIWSHLTKKTEILKFELLALLEDKLHTSVANEEREGTRKPEHVVAMNDRIVKGLSIAARLNLFELIEPISKIITNPSYIYPTVQAFAIRTLSSLVSHLLINNSTAVEGENLIELIRTMLELRLLNEVSESESDIIIAKALFSSIVELDPSSDALTFLFRKFVDHKRWSLIRTCRLLLEETCKLNLHAHPICSCFKKTLIIVSSEAEFCNVIFAGGWFGLSVDSKSKVGEDIHLHGELFNLNNNLSAAYSLQLNNGPHGELRSSQLRVKLIDENDINDLFSFEINANGLESLMGLGTLRRTSRHPKGSWINIRLTDLETGLLPITLFSGGLTELFSVLWSAPSTPIDVFQAIQSIFDERRYIVLSSGWIISINVFGLIHVGIAGALEASAWSRTGKSLVRTQISLVMETSTKVFIPIGMDKHSDRILFHGLGLAGELDFVTHVDGSDIPNGICMSMYRAADTEVYQWNSTAQWDEEEIPFVPGRFSYRELSSSPGKTSVSHWLVPSVSYNLGRKNSLQCQGIRSSTIW